MRYRLRSACQVYVASLSSLVSALGSHEALLNQGFTYRAFSSYGARDAAVPFQSVPFAGLSTFANLPYVPCMSDDFGANVDKYDIAILGAPFDTATTGRPGARFGPKGVRTGSQRIYPDAAWNPITGENAFHDWARIVDCGDAPLTWLDNTLALGQLEKAHRLASEQEKTATGDSAPRIIALGGDHTTTLPALRALHSRWGPVSVVHFDSHIDSWDPAVLSDGTAYSSVNHGTFLHVAASEGLVHNHTSIHVGVRAPFNRKHGDLANDKRCGFDIIYTRDIDRMGIINIAKKIRERVKDTKVYITVDIDVLDPAFAPATGTAEVGGWSTRELLTLLEELEGLPVVGADIVEVAPAYDNPGETTILAAAEIAHSLIKILVAKPVSE